MRKMEQFLGPPETAEVNKPQVDYEKELASPDLRNKLKSFLQYKFRFNDADAEDVIQNSLINALKQIKNGGFRHESSFYYWLRRIAGNVALDRIEDRGKFQPMDNTANDNVAQSFDLDSKIDAKRILDHMKDLTPLQHEAVKMFYLQKYTLQEMSQKLKIPVNTIKTRLSYARQKLMKIYEEVEGLK